MCAVSMITDHYRDKWPLPTYPLVQEPVKIIITPEMFGEYMKLKQAAEEYDKRNNQEDCAKPEIAKWEEYCGEQVEQYKINNLGSSST